MTETETGSVVLSKPARAVARSQVLRVVLLAVGIVLLSLSPEVAPRSGSSKGAASASFELAAKALRVGNVREARLGFEKTLRLAPDVIQAHMGLGHVAMTEGRFAQALEEYELAGELLRRRASPLPRDVGGIPTERELEVRRMQLEEQGPRGDAPLSLLEHGFIERETHSPDSRAPLVTGPENRPRPADIQFFIGNALFRLNRLGEAVSAWEDCRREHSDFAPVHNNLAVGYWKQERILEAQRSLARAEELGLPVSPALKAELRKSLAPEGRSSEATAP